MERLLDSVDEKLEALRRVLPEGEEELIRVQADLDEKGDFGTQWVVVTGNRVLVQQNGAVQDIPFAENGAGAHRGPGRRCAVGDSPQEWAQACMCPIP